MKLRIKEGRVKLLSKSISSLKNKLSEIFSTAFYVKNLTILETSFASKEFGQVNILSHLLCKTH